MTKRDIFNGDEEDLRDALDDVNRMISHFKEGTRMYITEAPTFRQAIYDLVSRGFNALGFMGVFDVVVLVDRPLNDNPPEVRSVIILHGYDGNGQLSTETIWPRPVERPPTAEPK